MKTQIEKFPISGNKGTNAQSIFNQNDISLSLLELDSFNKIGIINT
jgi:hypothetical protein